MLSSVASLKHGCIIMDQGLMWSDSSRKWQRHLVISWLQIFQWTLHRGGPSGALSCQSSPTGVSICIIYMYKDVWNNNGLIKSCVVLKKSKVLFGFNLGCVDLLLWPVELQWTSFPDEGLCCVWRYSYAIVGINLTEMAYSLLKSGDLKPHFYNTVTGNPELLHFHHLYCE